MKRTARTRSKRLYTAAGTIGYPPRAERVPDLSFDNSEIINGYDWIPTPRRTRSGVPDARKCVQLDTNRSGYHNMRVPQRYYANLDKLFI